MLKMSKQTLPQFKREGYKLVFSTFADDTEDKIVYIHGFFRKANNLTSPKARVQNRKRDKMRPMKINASRPEVDEGFLHRLLQGFEDFLLFFQFRDSY